MHLRRCIRLLVRLGGPSGSGRATAVGCQAHYASYGRRQRAVVNVVRNVTTGLRKSARDGTEGMADVHWALWIKISA